MNPKTVTNTELINKNGKPVDFSELEKGLFYKLTRFNLKDPLTFIVLAACFAPIIAIGVVHGDVLGEYLYLMVLPLTFYLVLPTVMIASRNYHNDSNSSLKWFAMANKWKLEELEGVPHIVPPSIKDQFEGSKHSKTLVINVELADLAFDVAHINLRDHQKEVQKVLTAARCRLPGQSPQIILDNREISSIFTGFESGLIETVLEGNFRQDFRLLHKPNEHIDALSVITPDVMHVSQASQTKFEIEVNGNYLYLFSKFDHTDERGITDLFRAMVKIAPEVSHQVRNNKKVANILDTTQN